MAMKHSSPFTFGDIAEHSSYHVLMSFTGKTVGCFLQQDVLRDLNVVLYFVSTFISNHHRNSHQTFGVIAVYLFIFIMLYLSSK